jgi:flavin reductase (DIM6/NTAB) family NADH-FMN oxidoreductase RutF
MKGEEMEDVKDIAMKIYNAYEDFYLDKEKRKIFEDLFDKYLTMVDSYGTMDVYEAVIALSSQYGLEFEKMVSALRENSLLPQAKEKPSGKIRIQNHAFLYPMPMVIVGAEVEGKPNYLAAAWVSRMNFKPPMIGAALGKIHYTNRGIHEHREFSLNVPGTDLMEAVDHIGLVSGEKMDKSDLFESFSGELKHAPMVKGCPVTMECRIVQIIDLPSNEVFIGEIVGAYSEERYMTDEKPDIQKMNPFTLTMPDNRYWRIGECIGKAWSAGKEFRKD